MDAESKPVNLALVAVHDKIMAEYDAVVSTIGDDAPNGLRQDIWVQRQVGRMDAMLDAATMVRSVLERQ